MTQELHIQKVTVIGAGVMGRQIAGVLANAGIQVYLLDIVPEGAENRNILAESALKELTRMKPPPLVSKFVLEHITPGNIEDYWDLVLESDWVIEAVIERLDIKQQLFKKMDVPELKARWVTTNTSGLSIHEMVESCSESFQRRFCGTHFFNPPRFLPLLEIIPHEANDRSSIESFKTWLRKTLGRKTILAKDTPNFIGNRLAIVSMLMMLRLMEKYGLRIEEVDALTGPIIGRPRTASFKTLDLVGLDIFAHTVQTLIDRAQDDEFHEWFTLPQWMKGLLEAGALGRKTKKGIYWRKEGERLVFDPEKNDYRKERKPQWPWLNSMKGISHLGERLQTIRKFDTRLYDFIIRVVGYGSLYAARRIPEIADRVIDIDCTIRWGFQWKQGPFEIWDELGFETIANLEEELPPASAPILDALREQSEPRFYRTQDHKRLYFDLKTKGYTAIPDDTHPYSATEAIRSLHDPIFSNPGASLYDLGDGVHILLWHPSGNAIGLDVLESVQRALEYTDTHGKGLIIASTRQHFSYGANLGLLLMGLLNRDAAMIDWTVRTFQKMTRGIRSAPFPVVVALNGMALGGGCEFTMHADRVVAGAESFIGLVELGAGVIPAGGGCAIVVERSQKDVPMDERVVPWVHYLENLKKYFEKIAMAQVSQSAHEAKEWGYLSPGDIIVADPDERIAVAKHYILSIADTYVPPPEDPVLWVLGEDGRAYLEMAIHVMHQGGFITDYEKFLATKLAYVLTGGDLTHPQKVKASYILDLERETFLQLCKEKKTFERAAHIIAFGKPLRN